MPRRQPPLPPARQEAIVVRRADVALLTGEGWTQARIAAKHGVTRQQIALDQKTINAEYVARAQEHIAEQRARQMLKLDALERAAWESLRKSMEPRIEKRTSVKREPSAVAGAPPVVVEETGTRTESQPSGDPSFVNALRAIVAEQNEVLGIYPPKETRLTGKDGGPVEVTDPYATLSEAELRTRLDRIVRGLATPSPGDRNGTGPANGTH